MEMEMGMGMVRISKTITAKVSTCKHRMSFDERHLKSCFGDGELFMLSEPVSTSIPLQYHGLW